MARIRSSAAARPYVAGERLLVRLGSQAQWRPTIVAYSNPFGTLARVFNYRESRGYPADQINIGYLAPGSSSEMDLVGVHLNNYALDQVKRSPEHDAEIDYAFAVAAILQDRAWDALVGGDADADEEEEDDDAGDGDGDNGMPAFIAQAELPISLFGAIPIPIPTPTPDRSHAGDNNNTDAGRELGQDRSRDSTAERVTIARNAIKKTGEENYYDGAGNLHRNPADGPARTVRNEPCGQVVLKEYYEHGRLHQGPAAVPEYRILDVAGGVAKKREYISGDPTWRLSDRDTSEGTVYTGCNFTTGAPAFTNGVQARQGTGPALLCDDFPLPLFINGVRVRQGNGPTLLGSASAGRPDTGVANPPIPCVEIAKADGLLAQDAWHDLAVTKVAEHESSGRGLTNRIAEAVRALARTACAEHGLSPSEKFVEAWAVLDATSQNFFVGGRLYAGESDEGGIALEIVRGTNTVKKLVL